jgi:hypothetical protein
MQTHPAAETAEQTYTETSRDGELLIELDHLGYVVRCQIEPEVMATWTSEQLGERIVRLYHVALMRSRCDARRAMNQSGADHPPDAVWPGQADIAAYRAQYITF